MKKNDPATPAARTPAKLVLRPAKATPPPPPETPSLFRRIDWLAMLLAFAVVWVMYFLTLAPELTLEDSGELVTGSYYAGIPHPPGYPVWTIYSWLWTVLVPWGNPAWRVALAEAFLGALACGLLSLMVSRGSSMLMEGIEELKGMTGKWESAICMVSGFVAGLLLGLDGFMWRESVAVNRIAVSSVPWFLIVLVCILRWLYAPHQHRYIYWALFVFGICFTTHQSLIVAAIGVQVAIAAGNPRIGRDVFFGNFVIYMLANVYWMVTGQPVFGNLAKPGLQIIYHTVGVGSLAASIWLAILTKTKAPEIGRNLTFLAALGSAILAMLYRSDSVWFPLYALAAVAAIAGSIYLAWRTWGLGREWLVVVNLGLLWILGFSFYFYMPISGMANPPMQWGYPRTVEGFFHALSRGQYEQPNPTNIVAEPLRFASQLWLLVTGLAAEFGWVYLFIAIVPFIFFLNLQRRERAWLSGLSAIYLCLGVLLVILLNPTPDRAAADLVKVFFCNSHTIIAALIGYGLALTAAFMATHYQWFRPWGLAGGAVAVALGVFCLYEATGQTYFGPAGSVSLWEWPQWIARAFAKNQLGLPIFGNLVLVVVPLAFVAALLVYRSRGPLLITLGLFLAMPLYSGLAHWYGSNQRNHMFGYWFGHDMFTPPFKGADGKPIYPEMTKDAILFGGTDPGRFCPTYMIFCESFTPHDCQPAEDQEFDRRDVYIITQNALADDTYLCYLRAQYSRTTQIDPPFFQELLRPDSERQTNLKTNLLARAVQPLDRFFAGVGRRVEQRRRTYTSWFTEKDFVNLPALAARLRPGPAQDEVSRFLYESFSPATRQQLERAGEEARLSPALARDFNQVLERDLEARAHAKEKAAQKIALDARLASGKATEADRQRSVALDKEVAELSRVDLSARFKPEQLSTYLQDFLKQNPQSDTRVRLDRLLLEAAYPKEIATSLGGVYPDREIHIPSPVELKKCYDDYILDAQRRYEQHQLKLGEDVKPDPVSGKVIISGQVAVMAINGLLCKLIFEHNPKNEFFVEESFPIDWMYPYLTPYGIILKLNRQPLPVLPDGVVLKDQEFWRQYSGRLIGSWLTNETRLEDIAGWVEKTYLRHNFNGFTGDRKFIHDDDAQKSFSKLRSAVAGIYNWRANAAPPGSPERERMFKAAELVYRQAFAFCPYSPEAVFHYSNFLTSQQRFQDALIVVSTCHKLDPFNPQVTDLFNKLKDWKKHKGGSELSQAEERVRQNPDDYQATLDLAGAFVQLGQTDRAVLTLDLILKNPRAGAGPMRALLQAYSSLDLTNKLQETVDRLAAIQRANPADWDAAIGLSDGYRSLRRPDLAVVAFDPIVTSAQSNPKLLASAAQQLCMLADYPKAEQALERLTQVAPQSPEAWYDLGAVRNSLGKMGEALTCLRRAVDLSASRLAQDPKAKDLQQALEKDPQFAILRQTPEYKATITPK
jgi:tetratricopeptide (TPR) repeat protein